MRVSGWKGWSALAVLSGGVGAACGSDDSALFSGADPQAQAGDAAGVAGGERSGSAGSGGERSGSAGSGGERSGSAGSGGERSGSGGTATDVGGAPAEGDAGGAVSGGGGTVNGCQLASLELAPVPPTVVILLDRSGSMFDDGGATWEALRGGLLLSLNELDDQIRYGFVAVSGELELCPSLNVVPPALANYGSISALYNVLAAPLKGESPSSLALKQLPSLFEGSAGDRHILFVTDGEPDFCSDGDAVCPIDATVHELQQLAATGIRTVVLGLPDTSASQVAQARYPAVLKAFADAGAGAPVAPVLPPGGTGPAFLYYSCSAVPAWQEAAVAADRQPTEALGIYSSQPGSASAHRLDPSDSQQMNQQLASVMAGLKSCTFELNGGVRLTSAASQSGHVSLNGNPLPHDADDGWYLSSPTRLELRGDACRDWREPSTPEIAWDFPCSVLEPL